MRIVPPVSVTNEYSVLRHCVLGIASDMYFCRPGRIFPSRTSPWWIVVADRIIGWFLAGVRLPGPLSRRFAAELRSLEEVLRARGIELSRPVPITPLPGEPPGLGQMFARDPIIAIGDTMVVARQKLPLLRKERRGMEPLLDRLSRRGCRIVRVPGPECGEEMYLEGGDVLVDLPHVYVGIGDLASNEAGALWLQKKLGSRIRVVQVPIVKPGIFHLDTCLALIGPRRAIVCRESLIDPLPAPLCDYDLMKVNEGMRRQIGVNVLMLDPNTVIIQKRHLRLRQALVSRGFEAIPLVFNWHALGGGAFRCVTHPLIRSD